MNEEKALEGKEDDEDEGKEEVNEGGEDWRRSKRREWEWKLKFNATSTTSPNYLALLQLVLASSVHSCSLL